jgi:hypothetical protein
MGYELEGMAEGEIKVIKKGEKRDAVREKK